MPAAADEVCEVIITAPDPDWLVEFTRRLVSDRLCASGHNFAPIRTIYRWQGQVHDKTEGRVALRTRRGLLPRIVDRAKREHPYEVPSVVAVPIIDGGPDYIAWILEQTEQPAWDELRAALAAGASFSHHAQGGGIWPDGRWHARPPAASTPATNPAPEPTIGRQLISSADFVGSIACP
jgi:periplasmic divalent cation tolerance protein